MTKWMAALSLGVVTLLNAPSSAQAVTEPVVQVVEIVADSVTSKGGQLAATGTVSLNIVGTTVDQKVAIPLEITASPGEAGACDILHLAVGPVHLDLLGLVVNLDDCDKGPVVVDIQAVEGGGLLGDLLCSIAGDLVGGADLADVLAGLTDEELATLTDGLGNVLSAVLANLLDTGVTADPDPSLGGRRRTDILALHLPDGVHLDVLGLTVDTSAICLDVFAERGVGNTLGNLLTSLLGLLDRPGENRVLVNLLVNRIARILDNL